MGNSKESISCLFECEWIIDKVNKHKIEQNSDLSESSINNKIDKSEDSEPSCGKVKEEDDTPAMHELPDAESAYSGDSFCSDKSSDSESQITDVTPRSLLSTLSSFSFNVREMTESDPNTKFPNDENEMYELSDDMAYLSMDYLGRINSSQPQFSSKRKNMTFTNEELMKIERDNQILLARIMKFQRPQTKAKTQNVKNRLSSSAINRRKLQKKIEDDNLMLLRKIEQAKPCVLLRANSAGCRLTFR
ncbi:cilia- and flagella-associated protein 97-like [Belonocnema kinseyi]|uniref:cilia- and flagella-associated protein 97-like n=1 Tax=Belonocnema kinseyi TaxID=2817044 RepID=UPI00143DDB0D|nr:cilia- and flagella-associated protein 97-like [Belonocnema kinseyi]